VSAFEQETITRLVAEATSLGVAIPRELNRAFDRCNSGNGGAHLWVRAHPDCETGEACCCWGAVLNDEWGCDCWVAEFDVEQAPPRPPATVADLRAVDTMCGDCAFRHGSPERADAYSEETLFALAAEGKPFWCHAGMRRPVRWRHPDGRVIDGSPDDWQPPLLGGVPYRADGSPGLLCAGWVARAERANAHA
jgi:hypothetical protein